MKQTSFTPATFMKTYGWAVLIIVSLVSMMFYFQIFDTSQVECKFSGAFGCKNDVAIVNSTHVSFFLEKQINSAVSQISILPERITFVNELQVCDSILVHPVIDRFEEEITSTNLLTDSSQVRVLLECEGGNFYRGNKMTIVGTYTVEGSENIQSFEGYILV